MKPMAIMRLAEFMQGEEWADLSDYLKSNGL
jgi:hypothetical protein